MIQGISHLTFLVQDLAKSADLFRYVFDAQEIYNSSSLYFGLGPEKFLLISGLWICLMESDAVSERSYNHVAFSIRDEDFAVYEERIRSLGLEVKPSRPRVPEEGRSIYFYDYDHHLFELHSGSLVTRLNRYSSKDSI
ncbi:MAG: FosX/FosE/FosI family fosfomycin resistance hydrolase [Deltaproteobacteria bacterium]